MNVALKIVVFLVLAAVVVFAAKSILKEREPDRVAPKIYTVKRMDIEQSVYGSGVLRCSRRAELVSRVAGKIRADDLLGEEGNTVKSGQILCKIFNEQVEKDQEQASKSVEIKQRYYDSLERDYRDKEKTHKEHGVPSKNELEKLFNELEAKKLELDQAKADLKPKEEKAKALTVTSPLEGSVLKSHLKRNEIKLDPDKVYPEGTPLFLVGDLTSLAVHGTVLESDRSRVREGEQAPVYRGKKGILPAKVTYLSLTPSAGPEGGKYEIHLDFEKPPTEVNEGLSVDFRIIVEKKGNVLAVPVEYVEVEGGRHWVKRVEGKKVERVSIEVGISNDSFYEVTGGLKEGDVIRWDAAKQD